MFRKIFSTKFLIIICGLWALAIVVFIAPAALIGYGGAGAASALMGVGLIVIWVIIGGLLMRRYRESLIKFFRRLPGGPRTRFVLAATILALIEEAVTVTMTNLAPLFGSKVGEAYITASSNYLDVVFFHSA